MEPMFSVNWFETFADKVPPAILEAELTGISRELPVDRYPSILDVGCGVGRIAGPLARSGYTVTGIDISLDALRRARRHALGPRYVALDYRHVGRMHWKFDAALVLWQSIGFAGRETDLRVLTGLATVVRTGGCLVLELFHPDWLGRNERSGQPDERGAASVRRWLQHGRCYHEIRYPNGAVDRIAFDAYNPAAACELVRQAGFQPEKTMVWWDPSREPTPDCARYQLLCSKAF